MGVLVVGTLISMVLVVRDALRVGRKGAERWGTMEIRHEAQRGPGAFRSGALTERRPHRAPWIVWVAGLVGAWMGVARFTVFVPLLIATALDAASHGPLNGFDPLPAVAALGAASSLLLSWLLFGASMALLGCVREAGARARRVGLSVVGLDLAVIACLLATAEPMDRVAFAAAALLVMGSIHGALLAVAGGRTQRRQAVLSDEEWGALPEE